MSPVLTVAVSPSSFSAAIDVETPALGDRGTFTYIFSSFAGRGLWTPSDIKEDRVHWILDQLMANYRPKLETGFTA